MTMPDPTTPQHLGHNEESVPDTETSRGGFFSTASTIAMVGGLTAGYGMLAWIAGRFLYRQGTTAKSWLFVSRAEDMRPGGSLSFKTPAGELLTIARRGNTGEVGDFLALSSTCPHLGCKVNWEPQNSRFFCPCHNGAFDPEGKAIAGPPAEANQRLQSYPLELRDGLLFIEVPTERLVGDAGVIDEPEGPTGPGQDPCLYQAFPKTSPNAAQTKESM